MASGKTSIGQALATTLHIPFFDLDQMIEEHEQMSISDLFAAKGELYFRKLEHQLLKTFIENPPSQFVMSWGGGTPCYANNHFFLSQEGITSIYLKAQIPTLIERIKQEPGQRPMLATTENLAQQIGPHLLERAYYYHFAQHRVTTDHKDEMAIVNEIVSLLA